LTPCPSSAFTFWKKDVDGQVSLAHRTVREYLQSPRIKEGGPAQEFYLPQGLCSDLCLTAIINRLLSSNFLDNDIAASYRWWEFSAKNFPDLIDREAHTIGANQTLCDKVFSLLEPKNGHTARISSELGRCGRKELVHKDARFWGFVPILRSEALVQGQHSLDLAIRLCVAGAWPIFKQYVERHDPAEQA